MKITKGKLLQNGELYEAIKIQNAGNSVLVYLKGDEFQTNYYSHSDLHDEKELTEKDSISALKDFFGVDLQKLEVTWK